jgi:hypothetical protein
MFTIKNFKSLSSGAYTATLYRKGKRVGTIEDDGRGGQPRLEPNWDQAGPKKYWEQRNELTAELNEWAKTVIPVWYLTSHGTYEPAGTPDWEAAIGFLTDCAEYNKLSKKGWLIRTTDGEYFTTPTRSPEALAYAKTKGMVWDGTDWTA